MLSLYPSWYFYLILWPLSLKPHSVHDILISLDFVMEYIHWAFCWGWGVMNKDRLIISEGHTAEQFGDRASSNLVYLNYMHMLFSPCAGVIIRGMQKQKLGNFYIYSKAKITYCHLVACFKSNCKNIFKSSLKKFQNIKLNWFWNIRNLIISPFPNNACLFVLPSKEDYFKTMREFNRFNIQNLTATKYKKICMQLLQKICMQLLLK